jgi:hypothetical protein
MLFDLRGKGRRRTVRVIYASLALLMGGGLVLFGIGGEVSGGLFNAFENEGGQNANEIVEERLKKAEEAAKTRPNDAAAWSELTRARFQAIGGDEIDQTGQYIGGGTAKARSAVEAWERYLKLDKTPDVNLAGIVRQLYGGLGEAEQAVAVQELIVEQTKPPDATSYKQLAFLAYAAGQTRKGDLSGKKALELATKDERPTLKSQLDQAKAAATQAAVQEATQGTTTVPTP